MENKNFEASMAELEERVKRLESGELSLDESIEEFERAIALVGVCNKKLEEAELKVSLLAENKDGSVSDRPFGINDEA